MRKISTFGFSILFFVITIFAGASLALAETPAQQKVVVSFKQNLYTHAGHEAACIATALGTLLASNGAEVTLFVTLDGVELGNATRLTYVDAYALHVGKWSCTTSAGPQPLSTMVNNFVSRGGSIMICPLCWSTRYGMESKDFTNGAFMPDSATLAARFLDADKLLDF